MKTVFASLSIALAAAAVAGPAFAEYPEKPVSFVVPFPPGDLEDVLTRMIAEDFAAKYDVPAAVVNKPGGGGGPFPGAIGVAGAPADGYTIGSFVLDVPLVGPQIGIPELNPNPFEPIGIFVTYPFVIATSKDAPYDNMEELAAYAQENDVALAHFGAELTPTQVTFAMAKQLGFEYASEAAFDAIDCNTFASGDADVGNTTIQLVLPCLDQVKVLVSLTDERIPQVDYAQAVGEVTPDLQLALWNGLFVRKEVPQDVRDKIAASAMETMASDRAQAVAAQTGAAVYWKDAEASQAQIDSDLKVMAHIGEILAE
ncbi:MAG TPA: tripartite tricarboxylate transporter substrate binding protein [Aliiroseovarius sp.]|nr:tripartite tricarboxylate transporter substrate binding protein [Aliiroseovarius sp.]